VACFPMRAIRGGRLLLAAPRPGGVRAGAALYPAGPDGLSIENLALKILQEQGRPHGQRRCVACGRTGGQTRGRVRDGPHARNSARGGGRGAPQTAAPEAVPAMAVPEARPDEPAEMPQPAEAEPVVSRSPGRRRSRHGAGSGCPVAPKRKQEPRRSRFHPKRSNRPRPRRSRQRKRRRRKPANCGRSNRRPKKRSSTRRPPLCAPAGHRDQAVQRAGGG